MAEEMVDLGRKETDVLLEQIEAEIRRQYAQAARELTEKLEKHLKQFETADKMMLSRLDAGEINETEYFRWRTSQIMTGKHWEQMRDQLTEDLVNADQLAASVIRGYMPEVYALNHNYGTYQIEHDSQMSTSYTLYNREAVERLLRDDPDLLPQPRVNIPKDERWNKKQINSSVIQGILQGDSMDKIARRMQNVCAMDQRAAIRNARTAVTGAENAGKLDSMKRAQGLGVELKKLWLATRDGRTRDSHVLLDGELREVDEKFSNGCMYPGDPQGAPAEVYNCRCGMRSKVAGADPYSPDLSRNERLGGMSYDEWKEMHRERLNRKLFVNKSNNDVEEHARLHTQNSNKVPLQALDAPGFTEKFNNITGNQKTDKAIYESAVEILRNRNETNGEDLHLIDMDTGEVLYKHTGSTVNNAVKYDDNVLRAIAYAHENGQKIISIHNHPNGLPPSLDDGSSALSHGYDLGITVGHNLEVWTYGRANKLYPPEFCEEVHSVFGQKFQYAIDFDDNEWYNLLKNYGMRVNRL